MKKFSKRIVAMLTVLAIVMVMMPAMAFADTAAEASVYVTIADEGKLVLVQEKVTATDCDNDGVLTINDVLYAAHEAAYEGGAAAGYATAMSSWGLSITTLWGDNSGAFGYYVNNASAWSLTDPVADGDSVYAYVYEDQVAWSDQYSYFDKKNVASEEGHEVELTLSYMGYDADWNSVAYPAAGAVITIDGVETAFVTDADGKATIVIEEAGNYLISAKSDSAILVPPVCFVEVTEAEDDTEISGGEEDAEGTVDGNDADVDTEEDADVQEDTATDVNGTDESPQTGDDFNVALYGSVAIAALGVAALCLRRKTCK